MRQDLKYALMQLAKRPIFAAAVVLTLALGIGANTAVFAVFHAVVLAEPPYPAAGELKAVTQTFVTEDGPFQTQDWTYPEYETLRDSARSIAVAAYTPYARAYNLAMDGDPARARVELVSASYFDILDVGSALGRTFSADEDATPDTHPVAVIADGLWRSAFGGDADAVGRTIRLNGVELEVVGVMPTAFAGLSGEANVWVPMMMAPALTFRQRLSQRAAFWHSVIARVPDDDDGRATAALAAASRAVTDEFASAFQVAGIEIGVRPLTDALTDRALARTLLILLGAVACVLLIACVNLANLLLARGVHRSRELGLRLALGASRGRLARQLLTEAALLGVLGGLAAIVVAAWALELFRALEPGVLTAARSPEGFGLSLPVLAFSCCLASATVLAFGVAPALAATRHDPRSMLGDARPGRARTGPRGALVVAEVALATVLVIAAGLLLRSLDRLQDTPLGFRPDGVFTALVNVPTLGYSSEEAVALFTEAARRIAARGGVEEAAIANCVPANPAGPCDRVEMHIRGGAATPASGHEVTMNMVSPAYFSALGIRIIEGRALNESDRADAPRVAVVTQSAAERYWPGGSPVGGEIQLSAGSDEWFEVVGVVGDTIGSSLREAEVPGVFLSYPQFPYRSNYLVVKTAGDARASADIVRSVLLELDRSLPLWDVGTMGQRLSRVTARDRFGAVLLGSFGAVALLLAGIGVYGVLAFLVARRRREVGLRMALGATQSKVSMLVLRQGLGFVLLGLGVGVVLALAFTRVLEGQLHRVSAFDPVTFGAAGVVLVSVAVLACLVPAYRAARVEPMAALRYE